MAVIGERFLVCGPTGSGKTYAWLTLAQRFPESTFHVLDTDASVERMLMGPTFGGLTNVAVTPALDWLACARWLDETTPKLKPGDWLVADFICSIWDFVQSYYVGEVFEKGIAEYFLEVRKVLRQGAKTLDALSGWTDWRVINQIYGTWAHRLFYALTSPPHLANVYAVAKAARLSTEDSAETLDLFGIHGLRPEGEKRNAFRVHTVLLFQADRNNFYVTTVKDRERQKWERRKMHDFGIEYGALAEW